MYEVFCLFVWEGFLAVGVEEGGQRQLSVLHSWRPEVGAEFMVERVVSRSSSRLWRKQAPEKSSGGLPAVTAFCEPDFTSKRLHNRTGKGTSDWNDSIFAFLLIKNFFFAVNLSLLCLVGCPKDILKFHIILIFPPNKKYYIKLNLCYYYSITWSEINKLQISSCLNCPIR